MAHQSRSRRGRLSPSTSKADVAIFTLGLIAAVASAVAAHRVVGPYGDGPLNVGLYRTEDPETGAQLVYRDVARPDGTVMRYLFNDSNRTLTQIQVRRVVDGKIETVVMHMNNGGLVRLDVAGESVARDGNQGGFKLGFSLRGNGVIDAWAYRNAAGQLLKVEVSRRQDGVIDRWEYYENDQLARVEEDENRDGRPDLWLTYDSGILIGEARDKDGDGRPDPAR